MAIVQIFGLLLPLFGLITLGYVLGRLHVAKLGWVTVFSSFNYYVAFPALVFHFIAHATFSFERHGAIVLTQIIIGTILLVGTYCFSRWKKYSVSFNNAYTISSYFGNAGYIGIPALLLVWGEQAAVEGTVIMAVMIFMTFTVGLVLLEHNVKHYSWKKIILTSLHNPLLLAALAGLIISVNTIPLPGAVNQLIQLLAQASVPTMLIGIGIFLAFNHPQRSIIQRSLLFILFRMFAIPGILLIVAWILPNGQWLNTTVVQNSMPIALTIFALSEQYPMDKDFISTSVSLSTLCSLITLPVVLWLVELL